MSYLDGRITRPLIVKKDWGQEEWVLNDKELNLCSKLLVLNKGKGFHFHHHLNKKEQFNVIKGQVLYCEIDPETRDIHTVVLGLGESIFINPPTCHSVLALEDSVILETSTFHEDSDSYRTHLNPQII